MAADITGIWHHRVDFENAAWFWTKVTGLCRPFQSVPCVLTFTIAVKQWRNPKLFTVPDLAGEQFGTVSEEPREGIPTQSGELDPAIRAEIFETIKNQFENDQLYLDNKLTLTRLSALTGVSKHHLSEVLNRHAGKNFYEFVNGYRVDFVRQRLEAGAAENVLDIALAAGFSSKSTFNAIFKQFTGQTPTQYRKGLRAEKT